MYYLAIGLLAFVVISFILAAYELHNAPTIDPNEPFLWDDYDPKKDPTLVS